MRKLFFFASILIALFGCGNEGKEKVKVENIVLSKPTSAREKMLAGSSVPIGRPDQDVTRKIIKDGEISFETHNIAETRKAIYNSLQKLEGYIAEEKETNDTIDNRNVYVLKARVPEKNFDSLLNTVSSNAIVIDSKNIRSRDVTTEYIDVTTRLANKRKLEERYTELLKRGSKISELLEIENKISQIETSVDSTQGELNYLIKQVEYSSLSLSFYTKRIANGNEHSFGFKFITALTQGWNGLVSIFLGVVSVWPLWMVIGIVFFIFKAWRKKTPQQKG